MYSKVSPAGILPNEPRIRDRARQEALTARLLLPHLAELELFFLAVRRGIDERLEPLQPVKHGKRYPLGQCLEISLAFMEILPKVDGACLSGAAAKGHAALSAFFRQGGRLDQVWGDLRGRFFQNAFVLGTLYLDVSNDTVVPTKPKVEILPFDQAELSPIRDYEHYMRIAASYWKARFVPNHVMPALAPYFPLICLHPAWGVMPCDGSDYMMNLTHFRQFRTSESVLRAEPMAPAVFDALKRNLAGSGLEVAATPEGGRESALRYCRLYRGQQRTCGNTRAHRALQHRDVAVAHLGRINVRATSPK